MAIQARSNLTNYSFIKSGTSYVRDTLTLLQDAARSAVLAAYTLMARVAVSAPTTGTAGTNTGDGTVTGVALIAGSLPRVGTWVLEAITAVTNGGTFKLTDPGGNIVRNDLVMTAGAGLTTTFYIPEAGLTFIITDGATDFIVGDEFTIAIAAVNKWAPMDPGAVNGAQIPRGVFMSEDVAAADLVAGDVTEKMILVGGACTVDSDLLVFENGATLATVLSGGGTIQDALDEIGIFAEDTIDIDDFENA